MYRACSAAGRTPAQFFNGLLEVAPCEKAIRLNADDFAIPWDLTPARVDFDRVRVES